MILSISFFHSWLITFNKPSGEMSSLEPALAPAAPPVAVVGVICFSEEVRSVVADYSPVFSPSAVANAAAFCLSNSDGTPLLSLIS